MAFENLPAIIGQKLDGNLAIIPVNDNPIVLVIGTASKGDSETLYRVDRVSDAGRTFGKTGTLIRGLYEATIGGAQNVRLFRIGATSATLIQIGQMSGETGLTLETDRKDDSAGEDYELFFDASAKRLYVYRATDDELVYDNNPTYPNERVDLGEVFVSGTITGTPTTDIGTASVPLAIEDCEGEGESGEEVEFTAGTDGTDLSRIKLYEHLYAAYNLLSDQDVDVVIPMNVYLDDLNILDMTVTEITAAGSDLTDMSSYPTAGSTIDVLGKLYTEEYEGVDYYWWWFPSDPTADADTTFTSDSGASMFPTGIGSASALLTTDGTALTGSDFHEVNFAYQLADFCYRQSEQNAEMTGVVGVLPPDSYSLKDVSNWVGQLPTTEEDANANIVVASGGNGTGLLGNKFMSGRTSVSNELTAYSVNSIAGLYNGGFPCTEDGWLDGTQVDDDNDHLIDIGKYISVVATYPFLSNPSRVASYAATGATTYGGFYSVLPPDSAPTNKQLRNLRLPFRVGTTKLDLLAGQRYVTFHAKPKGIVISDAPTAARPDSDYQRLSTIRQVKACMDTIRNVGEPFLGEGMTASRLAALDTAIDGALKALVTVGVISRYDSAVSATPTQRILGQATVELKLVPAFELRQITVVVGLAAV